LRCFLALLVFFLTQCVSGAQDSHSPPERPSEEFTLTINANMVLLSATVLDRHNALVSGLVQDDFRVYEDGVLQPLRFFSHEDIPVTAGILVDNSASMGSKRSDVIASAMAFARSSNPQDQMFVVHFSDRVSFGLAAGTQFTDRPEMLLAALSNIHAAGQTALYDGIAAGLEHLKRGKSEKKVLILIADGDDNASKSSLAQIIEMAKQSSAIIYAIGIFDEQDGDQKPGVLKRLARETGGEAFFPESSSELGVICKEIARDIRNQYMLAYVPRTEEKAGSYRTIEVKASAPHHGSLHVRTRAGYTVSAAPPAAAKETVHDTRQ
jgi:VWFA-related protein